MQKRTTTKQLNEVITDHLLKLIRAEKYNKSTRQKEAVGIELFKDSLDFLCETLFVDAIGWHYECDMKTGQYVVEAGRMNGDSEDVVIAYLCACDGVDGEEVERRLKIEEE